MEKHYFIYDDNPKHGAVSTKGLKAIRPERGHWIRIIFVYETGGEIYWNYNDEKELCEALERVKKSLKNSVNINDNITL